MQSYGLIKVNGKYELTDINKPITHYVDIDQGSLSLAPIMGYQYYPQTASLVDGEIVVIKHDKGNSHSRYCLQLIRRSTGQVAGTLPDAISRLIFARKIRVPRFGRITLEGDAMIPYVKFSRTSKRQASRMKSSNKGYS